MLKSILKLDWVLIVPIMLLSVSGLVAVYSLSIGTQHSGLNNFDRQLIFFLISAGAFFVFSFLDYRIWRSYAGIFYLVSIVLLVLVFVIGKSTHGAVSWFRLGFFNFQPVEFVKISLLLLLAKYFSQVQIEGVSWKNIFVSFGYAVVPIFLVALQPDMGSAMVLMAIWLGVVFLAGINIKQVVTLIAVGFIAIFLMWTFFLHDYQKQRVLTFLNPGSDALGSGYNVIQATVAIGSGGLTGKGLGHGSQSQLNFIPERHTDFIFATIAEESGLIGVVLILLFFGIIFYRMKVIMEKSKDVFGKLIVGGVMTVLFFQIFVNIGMNLGVMPVAGLSLPFLSYGGSFLLTTMILLGIVENVWSRNA